MGHDRQQKQSVVFIASEAVLAAWRAQPASHEGIELCDADGMDPLQVISRSQPQTVVLEQDFACTERGAALIGRLQTESAFQNLDIRLLQSERAAQVCRNGTSLSLATLAQSIRPAYSTARRAARRKVSREVRAEIDGRSVTLVDLSTGGAQVLSAAILHPNQHVHVVLADSIRIDAKVVWLTLEMPSAGPPRYRAGIEFLEFDSRSLDELLLLMTPHTDSTT